MNKSHIGFHMAFYLDQGATNKAQNNAISIHYTLGGDGSR